MAIKISAGNNDFHMAAILNISSSFPVIVMRSPQMLVTLGTRGEVGGAAN